MQLPGMPGPAPPAGPPPESPRQGFSTAPEWAAVEQAYATKRMKWAMQELVEQHDLLLGKYQRVLPAHVRQVVEQARAIIKD